MLRRASLRLCAALILAALLAVLAAGHALTRPALRTIGPAPAELNARTVSIPTTAGTPVVGWYSPGQAGAGAVLLLHGVRSDRASMLGRAHPLHARGHAVLLIDLPAHGESPGARISFGRREALGVTAVLGFLAEQAKGERIAVIGVSLGAAALTLATPRPAPAAVVLESMYPTIEDAVADRLALHAGEWTRPLAPLLLLQSRLWLGIPASALRPIEHIAQIGSPMLMVAGDLDRHTRVAETRHLFSAAMAPKALWVVEGAAHVDLHAFDPARYEARIGAFLAPLLRQPPP